jgi:hypothetical protein
MHLGDHAAERARQIAASAPAPDPETVARLRALLGVTPAGAASRAA